LECQRQWFVASCTKVSAHVNGQRRLGSAGMKAAGTVDNGQEGRQWQRHAAAPCAYIRWGWGWHVRRQASLGSSRRDAGAPEMVGPLEAARLSFLFSIHPDAARPPCRNGTASSCPDVGLQDLPAMRRSPTQPNLQVTVCVAMVCPGGNVPLVCARKPEEVLARRCAWWICYAAQGRLPNRRNNVLVCPLL